MSTKVRTFYPKVPKTIRDNQNRKTPLTQDLLRLGDFKIQEIAKEDQVKKLRKSYEKTDKQIRKLIQRIGREPSQRARLEARKQALEDIAMWKLQRIALLMRGVHVQEKKEATQKENVRKEMQAHIKNLEKIKPKYNPLSEVIPDKEGNLKDDMSLRKPVELKRIGNTLKLRRKKRFSKS